MTNLTKTRKLGQSYRTALQTRRRPLSRLMLPCKPYAKGSSRSSLRGATRESLNESRPPRRKVMLIRT